MGGHMVYEWTQGEFVFARVSIKEGEDQFKSLV
jgi:hypothetical protein